MKVFVGFLVVGAPFVLCAVAIRASRPTRRVPPDLRRADSAQDAPAYDSKRAFDAVMDKIASEGPPSS